MLKARGKEGFQQRVSGCTDWADQFVTELERRHNTTGSFQLFLKSFSTVCFWYVPRTFRSRQVKHMTPESDDWRAIDRLPPIIRASLITNEEPVLVSHGKVSDLPTFFRLGLSSAPTDPIQSIRSITTVLDTLERVGELAGQN